MILYLKIFETAFNFNLFNFICNLALVSQVTQESFRCQNCAAEIEVPLAQVLSAHSALWICYYEIILLQLFM